MTVWQRRTRLALLISAIGVVIAVAAAYRRGPAVVAPASVAPADPKALVESAGGWTSRLNRDHEEVRIDYEKLTTYPDKSSKLTGVKVTTIRAGGRKFVITGNQADLKGENDMSIHGDVRIVASDGMEIRTEHASYTDTDAIVRAPGPVEFSRGRLNGSGLGATYAKNDDVLTIGSHAVVHMKPNPDGKGGAEFSSGSVEFIRNQHVVRLNGGMTVKRSGQTLEAESGVAHLTEDEQRLEAVELRNQSKVTTDGAAAGGLKGMRARDIDVKYGPDGETLQQAVLDGKSEIDVAGEKQQAPRKISANHLEVALSSDGSTPKSLVGTDAVQLTIPGDRTTPTRIIESQKLEGTGEEGRGLTRARFTGDVLFRERTPNAERHVRSSTLTATVKAGLSEIEDARFEQAVRFEDGDLTATAAQVRYVLGQGTLELTGSEPANPVPRMENPRISVGASRIDVTLDGPVVAASNSVRSALKPAPRESKAAKGDQSTAKVPSMFKQDQLVAATADQLKYDGAKSSAVYTGNAQLWQGDTSIKGSSITLNQESGDLTAAGPIVTAIALEQEGKDKTRERVHSTGTSKSFAYEESSKRATYTGDAHLNGPQGDMAAAKIELYLKQSGDELDRAEAYEAVTLRDQNRETKGARMTYFSADERYVVTGAPVTITDECARVTTGRTATFSKATDTVIVDGNQTRTATRGSANCTAR
jgi:LPS export ABC transporter protein LptC/lipopolysaccharide transport protein LptA